MKKKLFYIFITLLFPSAIFSQIKYDYEWAVFSELTSIFRTNSSVNLNVERKIKDYRLAFGTDLYLDILTAERQFRTDEISYGLTFKASKEFMYMKKKVFHAGIFVRYAEFHTYQYDEMPAYDDDFREYGIYEKDYGKLTPMIFMQFDFDKYENILIGFQMAMGYPILMNVRSELTTDNSVQLKNDGYPSNFWNNFLEHNVPFNRWGKGNE